MDHNRQHDGQLGAQHDADHWDQRYAADASSCAEIGRRQPIPALVELAGGLTTGRALDLGAGQGRNSLWLAAQGWAVTAVDFSAVGVGQARALEGPAGRLPITWVVADVQTWQPAEPASYDLIVCSYLHLDEADFARVRTWLTQGGRLLVIGPSLAAEPGPRNPAYRYTEAQLRTAATGLTIDRLDETAGVLTLVGHRD